MRLISHTPKRTLNKAFLKQRPLRSQMDLFKAELVTLLERIDPNETEEFHKNLISDFLKKAIYQDDNFINTKGRQDLVIHNGKDNKTKVGVIIEAKRPSNKSDWFTCEKPNSKAIHELVLYYLRERIECNNIDIKYLVATNINEWYIIEAKHFENFFYKNKNLVKNYEEWRDGKKVTKDTGLFYNEIAKPFIEQLGEEIPCTYFNIQNYVKVLKNADKEDDKNLIALLKILSPQHLLKLPFANDSNELDDKFYKELLHIIGLEEAKDNGKNIIRRKVENKYPASLLEMVLKKLKTKGVHKINDIRAFGETFEQQYFNIALELCITWINRILFLKLLEGQLINYHKGDRTYRFLNSTLIHDFDELFKLFHNVLAVNISNREEEIKIKYKLVPYLNSSLFEIGELEDLTICIDSLDNSEILDFNSTSVLKEQKKKNEKLKTLDYLFLFLDSYDFASEGSENIQEDNKPLINASVLGKVFEKINGYKEGSIYTPGFITMYMCRQSIRLSVVEKFNEAKNWNIKSFEEIYNKIEDINEANKIINEIKICDPAVGSGHFLVSALNEIIAIKSELNILTDAKGKRLKEYTVEVENDDLYITDDLGDIFDYNPKNKESQRIQETLFLEKQKIIENCLFGVDSNPNSVKICRLRLWIELLKNAYYKEDSNYTELETLPNIDINIKCGNSLLSRFPLDADLSKALKSVKYNIESYRGFVTDYKNEKNRDVKKGLQKIIDAIKTDFRTEIGNNDPKKIRLSKLSNELFLLLSVQNSPIQTDVIKGGVKKEKERKKKLEEEIDKLTNEIEEIKNNTIYKNAFEWRFEFPEILSISGEFEGFDLVIANPPYIRQEELGVLKNHLREKYKVFVSGGDIFSYFYELSYNVLKKKGMLSFINNTFDKTTAGKMLRNFTTSNFEFKRYIDFTSVVVFDEATTYPIILIAKKSNNLNQFKYYKFSKETFNNKELLYDESIYVDIDQTLLNPDAWNFLNNTEQNVYSKISEHKRLGELYGKCYRGIITGLNEAFITGKDLGSDDILKPVYDGKDLKKWQTTAPFKKMIIFKSKSTKISLGDIDEESAFNKMEKEYPQIMAHLVPFKKAAVKRYDKGDFWWELRNCAYYDLFDKPKIIFPNLQNSNKFAYDTTGVYLNAPAVFLPSDNKYLLAILNSKIVWHFLKSICVIRSGGYIEVKPQYFEQIPIPEISKSMQELFERLVEYLLFLHDEKLGRIFTHTSNERIVKHIEDILNMMVYELYFEEHMKETGIDVLRFIHDELMEINEKSINIQIEEFYLWYQKPVNPVRQRMLLVETRSKDKIAIINKSIQQ